MRDGRRSECKACNSAAKKQWYARNREEVIAQVKRRQQANKDVVNARNRADRESHPSAMTEWHLRRSDGTALAEHEALLQSATSSLGQDLQSFSEVDELRELALMRAEGPRTTPV